MSQNIFIPTTPSPRPPAVIETEKPSVFLRGQRWLVIFLAVMLPVFFVWAPGVPLGFTKSFLAASVVVLIGLIGLVSVLCKPQQTFYLPKLTALLLVLAGIVLGSSLFAPNIRWALQGSLFAEQTAGFMLLLIGLMVIPLVLQSAPRMFHALVRWLTVSVLVVVSYCVVRFFFTPNWLSFGVFTDVTLSPFGSINDVALAVGALLCAALVRVSIRVPTVRSFGYYAVLFLFGLAVLSAANMILVWVPIALLATACILFVSGWRQPRIRDVRFGVQVGMLGVVGVVALFHVIGGSYASTYLQQVADIQYIEVRPSLGLTTTIARTVFADSWLLGSGPNSFVEQWRLHKGSGLNETVFWNTDFQSGFSFVATTFILFGVAGGVTLVALHGYFLWVGYRALTADGRHESPWFVPTVSVFMATLFLVLQLYFYTPGVAVLLLTALLFGASVVGCTMLVPTTAWVVRLRHSTAGPSIVKYVLVLSLVAGLCFLWYQLAVQYYSESIVRHARATNTLSSELLMRMYTQYPDELFLRLQMELAFAELQALLSLPSMTEVDEVAVMQTVETLVANGKIALSLPYVHPASYLLTASIYNALATAGNESARAAAIAVVEAGIARNPTNPEFQTLLAQLQYQAGDVTTATETVSAAVALKSNFVPALLLQVELAVATGNVDQAIAQVEWLLQLEPSNPVRYFQLGMLYGEQGRSDDSIAAYKYALELAPNYTAATQALADQYYKQGRLETAIAELESLAVNDDAVSAQLAQWRQEMVAAELGTSTSTSTPAVVLVPAMPAEPAVSVDNAVTVTTQPDTDLVVPANQGGQ